VPDPQRKGFTSVTELPNPDLNPLLNPTLGRNLGRWAEVYFTTPPEKREEAVEELLRELEGSSGTDALEPSGRTAELACPLLRDEGPVYAQTCPECGQGYETPQRYCGMCGKPLLARDSRPETQPLIEPMPEVAGRETTPTQVAPTRSLAGFDSAVTDRGSRTGEISEIRWLREKRLGLEKPPSQTASSPARRYATVALALFAIATLVYVQARSKKAPASSSVSVRQDRIPGAARSEAEASPAHGSEPPVAEPSRSQSEPSKSLATPAGNSTKAATLAPTKKPLRPQVTPVAAPIDAVPPLATTANPGNGSAELDQAEDYLNGKNGSRDAAVAARLLWTAVGKENTSAILLLSDMYMIGDGVPKSCDQAKVLLYAAARKHVAQAADKLRNLQQSGCP
jgi:hypothetical protein